MPLLNKGPISKTAKINSNIISIERTVPQIVETVHYDYDFLLSQKTKIEADLARVQAELDEVNDLLAQADSLGVVSKIIVP